MTTEKLNKKQRKAALKAAEEKRNASAPASEPVAEVVPIVVEAEPIISTGGSNPEPVGSNVVPVELTEVDPSKGLTPEQMNVALALADLKPAVEAKPILRRSEIVSPTKTVWFIADAVYALDPKNPNLRRDVIARCSAERIAYNTAKTQFQLWKASTLGGGVVLKGAVG